MISFRKYHGLGNDFVMVREEDVKGLNPQELAINLCNRHTGIGADGLIIVGKQPLTMIYYNSDGSRAKMCGNGIRCFANYCVDEQIVTSPSFRVQTLAGEYQIKVVKESPFIVEVVMGQPDFTPSNIPVITTKDYFLNEPFIHKNKQYNLSSVFMGTVHTTVEVENLEEVDIEELGQQIQSLEVFPDSTNVNVYQVLNETTVKMQTYERGAGLTLACGTGATAVYAVLRRQNNSAQPVTFLLPLGTMTLQSNSSSDIIMTGPAEFVYAGTIGVIL